MTYLLDTCTVSDFAKGERNTLRHIKLMTPSDIFISSITLMEIHYGMLLNPDSNQKIRYVIEDFLDVITISPFTETEATEAGKIRTILKAQGSPISAYNLLIAATAKVHYLTIVTSNVKEFERVPDLRVINWRG
ncbi:type II toxin-antitoxin system VapC family toxin [Crocosphaera sp. XPORK-15E]|uniref:type II toxin-antitoxin system VapC family toxin n=1 Tax=Crocosphaera sp. XPORK-15E TaxID=3110247 RepID=UPI002B209650|nr:type II toxin-antitoxin system VapC family toxin [Crocosphaera sp. XPORK-15E]MEA5534188.1 type II toxin-antitoxin system VapC family toxin [Crocosphaera sp. XPORK-15E]